PQFAEQEPDRHHQRQRAHDGGDVGDVTQGQVSDLGQYHHGSSPVESGGKKKNWRPPPPDTKAKRTRTRSLPLSGAPRPSRPGGCLLLPLCVTDAAKKV